MRLRLGRPDITRYAARFALPVAQPRAPVAVTFLGVTSLLVSDDTSAVMTDGFFSRPRLSRVALGVVSPDSSRVRECLARAGVSRLDAVVPVHTHYDHALDCAVVSELTGARLVGGESAANVGRGHGLASERLVEVEDGATVRLGAFEATFRESEHCPPDRFPGPIRGPVRPPVRARAYRCGEAWSLLVRHVPSDRRLLIQGSAGFRPGALAGQRAEVAYLGVGQLGARPTSYLRSYWQETVRAVGARRAVLIHWDDFFRPLDRPLVALPYAGDDLNRTMRTLSVLADDDGVDLQLPRPWERADPWADLPRDAG